jgi:hypothetical protein
MTGRIVSLAGALLVLNGLCATPARADKPGPPFSYRVVSGNGAYVLVMLPPRNEEEDPRHWIEDKANEIRAIRAQYSQSGLYRNDGSKAPLWTVDWYAFTIHVASDGIHLVRRGPWASRYNDEAVSFLANGRLLRTYRIDELVESPKSLPHSVSHFQWLERDAFNDDELRYTVWTKEGKRIDFNVKTGEIVASSPDTAVGQGIQPHANALT